MYSVSVSNDLSPKRHSWQILRVPVVVSPEIVDALLDPENAVSLETLPHDLYIDDFAPDVDAKVDAEREVARLLERLTPLECQVVLTWYELNGTHNKAQYIASSLDKSRRWVYKTYNLAMEKLREGGEK